MTVSVIERGAWDALPVEIEALIPTDAPDIVGVGWIAEWLKLTPPTVLYQIKRGKLPAVAIPGGKGTIASYAIRPRDAARLWGRLVLSRRAKETEDKT